MAPANRVATLATPFLAHQKADLARRGPCFRLRRWVYRSIATTIEKTWNYDKSEGHDKHSAHQFEYLKVRNVACSRMVFLAQLRVYVR